MKRELSIIFNSPYENCRNTEWERRRDPRGSVICMALTIMGRFSSTHSNDNSLLSGVRFFFFFFFFFFSRQEGTPDRIT